MKLVLDNNSLTEDFFAGTHLLGIMAPIRNYQFAWQLNNHLGFNFRLNTDIDKQLFKKNRRYFFSVYQHCANSFLSYYLYHNHCDGEYLLPEFRHMDYLWLVKGDEIDFNTLQDLIGSIKSLTCVQMVAELTHEKVRNKQHLVF